MTDSAAYFQAVNLLLEWDQEGEKNTNMTRKPLFFIFEIANNHSGDLSHGLEIVRQFAKIASKYPFEYAFKFQYRDLETMIHKDYRDRMDMKYIRRFQQTKLSDEDFIRLKREVERQGMKAICTPFDEVSVEKIVIQDFHCIKIASCSFSDWPLLEKVAGYGKKVIASTAGASLDDIDNVVTFFRNRRIPLVLMHCVGEYPTEDKNLHLGQIDFLRNRYPDIEIGFSTHERPDNTDTIKIAISKGASVFERHIGLDTPEYPLNEYSSTPQQIERWLEAAQKTLEQIGEFEQRRQFTEKELNDLQGLRRGVFLKRDLEIGDKLSQDNIYYAIPCMPDQLLANDISKYIGYTLKKELKKDQAVYKWDVERQDIKGQVSAITEDVLALLRESEVVLPRNVDIEISHHYGLDDFHETGAAILSIINREYCKKLIILLPGQNHPVHKHLKKEETFHVLYGELSIILEDREYNLNKGNLLTVERGVRHSFSSKTGCIFEEISTTHYMDDSFYEDEKINSNRSRKTKISIVTGN